MQNDTVVQRFSQSHYDISVLSVDFAGEYAFGFLRDFGDIFDIARSHVTTLRWKDILPNVTEFFAKDAETSVTSDGVTVLLLVGSFRVDFDSTLPAVYLFRLRRAVASRSRGQRHAAQRFEGRRIVRVQPAFEQRDVHFHLSSDGTSTHRSAVLQPNISHSIQPVKHFSFHSTLLPSSAIGRLAS